MTVQNTPAKVISSQMEAQLQTGSKLSDLAKTTDIILKIILKVIRESSPS